LSQLPLCSPEEDTGQPFAASHAARRTGKLGAKPAFFDYLAGAADRVGIATLSHDVVKIRNSLIHEGTLQNTTFPTQAYAAQPIAEALRWVDEYVYSILSLGPVPKPRHLAQDITYGVNSFSF
jgi:hypothetical protein